MEGSKISHRNLNQGIPVLWEIEPRENYSPRRCHLSGEGEEERNNSLVTPFPSPSNTTPMPLIGQIHSEAHWPEGMEYAGIDFSETQSKEVEVQGMYLIENS